MGAPKDHQKLTTLCNKLFMYTDLQHWDGLLTEVFSDQVWFDMTSAGGEARSMAPSEICTLWKEGFAGIDAVHHQAGQYLISVEGDSATIFAYAVAWHYKQGASNGKTRTFVGSYDLKAVRGGKDWRLNQFKYNLKFVDGNEDLT